MRKQVGQIDAGLLERVDALAADRGQTRRVVVERALEAVLSEAKGARSSTRSGSAPVPSTPHGEGAESDRDGVRPAAQPPTHVVIPASNGREDLRSNGHLPSCKCWKCVG